MASAHSAAGAIAVEKTPALTVGARRNTNILARRATHLAREGWRTGAAFARSPQRTAVVGFALALSHAVALVALGAICGHTALPQRTGAVVADSAQHRHRHRLRLRLSVWLRVRLVVLATQKQRHCEDKAKQNTCKGSLHP